MSDPILHLASLQSPVFVLNSRLGLFTVPQLLGDLFSRSYEVILPSSLATDHSSALGYSPRLPVSVYGTDCVQLELSGFSWKPAWGHYHLFPEKSVYYHVSAQRPDLPCRLKTYALQRAIPSARSPYASPSPHRIARKYWNLNQFAIGITSRLILRARLTLI